MLSKNLFNLKVLKPSSVEPVKQAVSVMQLPVGEGAFFCVQKIGQFSYFKSLGSIPYYT